MARDIGGKYVEDLVGELAMLVARRAVKMYTKGEGFHLTSDDLSKLALLQGLKAGQREVHNFYPEKPR